MNHYLQSIAARNDLSPYAVMADGIIWADRSCRISGTLSLAIRNASNKKIDSILDRMIADGCTTMADACRWLNAHYHQLTA